MRELAADAAHKTGLLPHEILLSIARGDSIKVGNQKINPSLSQRIQAATAAAPYFAPRLVTHEVGGIGGGAIQVSATMQVQMYTPDNGRRVAPPAAANDALGLPLLDRKQA